MGFGHNLCTVKVQRQLANTVPCMSHQEHHLYVKAAGLTTAAVGVVVEGEHKRVKSVIPSALLHCSYTHRKDLSKNKCPVSLLII